MSNFHSAELNRLMAQQQADMADITSTSIAYDEGDKGEVVTIDYAELLDQARQEEQLYLVAGFYSKDDFEEAADEFFARWADHYAGAVRKEKGIDLQVRHFKAARKLSF